MRLAIPVKVAAIDDLARAADEVWVRQGVILNPHYGNRGNLFGSAYWTYLLPRYAGEGNAAHLIEHRLPMGSRQAHDHALVQRVIDGVGDNFVKQVERLQYKRARGHADESVKPLAR